MPKANAAVKSNWAREHEPPARVAAVLAHAKESGLIAGKTARIAGRVSPELIRQAKASTGLTSDTALIEYALASVAETDNFAAVFRELRGTIPADLDLEF